MRFRGLIAGFAFATIISLGQTSNAQDLPQSRILTIDPDRLFAESARGREILQQIESETAALAAENRLIEADLISEEQALTDRRAELPASEFRALADAFDEKVQEIRATQDQKTLDLIARRDAARQGFISDSVPVLATILRERGAVILLNRDSVFLSADAIDITDATIARIDSGFSQGQPVDVPPVETPESNGVAQE